MAGLNFSPTWAPRAGVVVVAVLGACHDPKEAVAPRPCPAQGVPVLSFAILERTGTTTPDTAVVGAVTFLAPGAPYTAYEWKVGNDPRTFTQQRVALNFAATDTLRTYAVRLIAHRPLNQACSANDSGVDTLTRALTIAPYASRKSPLLGRFHGANLDAPADTFTVRLAAEPDHRYPPGTPNAPVVVYLTNLGKGCASPWFEVAAGWHGAALDYSRNDYGCFAEVGTAQVADDRRTVRIEYSQLRNFPNRTSRVFVGHRVR
jgi:hypothetical protein